MRRWDIRAESTNDATRDPSLRNSNLTLSQVHQSDLVMQLQSAARNQVDVRQITYSHFLLWRFILYMPRCTQPPPATARPTVGNTRPKRSMSMGEGSGSAASKPKLNVKVHVIGVAGRSARRMGVCTLTSFENHRCRYPSEHGSLNHLFEI